MNLYASFLEDRAAIENINLSKNNLWWY
jgi:hypothetical protein